MLAPHRHGVLLLFLCVIQHASHEKQAQGVGAALAQGLHAAMAE